MCQWTYLRRYNVNTTEGTSPPGDRTRAFESSQLVSECLCHRTPNDDVLAMTNPITSHCSRGHISLYYCKFVLVSIQAIIIIIFFNSMYFGSL